MRRFHSIAVSTAFLLAISTNLSRASAQDGSPAEELFREGNVHYQKGEWADAREAYLKAFAIKPSFDIAGNLGDVELKLGKHRDAAEHLAFSLRHWPAGRADAKEQTKALLAQARAGCGAVKISVSVPGAEIRVRGRKIGNAPLGYDVFVEPGAVHITVTHAGYKAARRTLALARGEEKTLDLVLQKQAGEGATGTPETNLPPDRGGDSPSLVPVYVGAGVFVVGAVIGTVFTLNASSKRSDRDAALDRLPGSSRCGSGTPFVSECEEIKTLDSDARSAQTLGFVGFGVAGAAALTTAAYWFWPRSKEAAVRVAPTFARQGAGLSLDAKF